MKHNGFGGHIRLDWLNQPSATTVVAAFRTYCVERWAVDIQNELQEVTSTCSGGFVERIAGANSWTADVSFFVDYYNDLESPIFDGAPNNAAGTALNLKPQFCDWNAGQRVLITLRVGGPGKNATTFHELQGFGLISQINVENPAKNPIKMTLQVQSSGPIKYVTSKLNEAVSLFPNAPTGFAPFDNLQGVEPKKAEAKKEDEKPASKA